MSRTEIAGTVEDWTARTFALAVELPNAAASPACFDVWSPVRQRHVRLPAADVAFLRQFREGTRPGLAAEPNGVLDVFLRIQRYLLLGILVEKLVLSPDEVGALHVGATCGAEASRVRNVCAGASGLPSGHVKAAELRVCRRPDGELVLLDNVEAARAAFLSRHAQPVQLLQPADFVRRVVDAPTDFFGTLRAGVPYQSVYCDGEELVNGRRRALYQRLALVRPSDLEQRAVLDLGCNIGMNCYLAVELGARLATGVDRPELVSAAAWLNGFYGRPCRFLPADLNRPLEGVEPHDTAFVFSLIGHLESVDGVLQTIERARVQAVYVETHRPEESQGELERFLDAPLFRRVDFVGNCENSAFEGLMTRRLYRCEVGAGPSR